VHFESCERSALCNGDAVTVGRQQW